VLVDVGELVSVVARTIAEASPDRTMHVGIDRAGKYLCLVDPVRLEQIVSNLLHNAIKFTEIGGCIDVCVRSVDGFANVSVADNGAGICPNFLPHVFTMFGQEMRSHPAASEGLGIGLALVQELAKAHGGRVIATSDGPGLGAVFTVSLPLAGLITEVDTWPLGTNQVPAL
jgi:two-component system CheB/CheR fusion protein